MAARRYDRRSRLAAAEETRRRIVRATAELHAEHGALGTSHAMIAERAGVSIPTVYKYFPTRDDLVPHCTGLVFSEAPVRLDETVFEGKETVEERLLALTVRTFDLYVYLEPWLRWCARDATELPSLRDLLGEIAAARAALVREALAPGFGGPPPAELVALGSALLDFPSWQQITGAGPTSARAASLVGESLAVLFTHFRKDPT